MSTHSLQDYCLQAMGIVQWQRQSAREFMVILNEELNAEKNQLIDRMLVALKWPKKLCQIEVCQSADYFAKRLQEVQPKKALVFGEGVMKSHRLSTTQNPFSYESVEIAILPSLNDLLVNPGLKKQAWHVMQQLM